MAELTRGDASADPCCSPEDQLACCEQTAKADCCNREERCDCDAGAADIGETDRERHSPRTRRPRSSAPGGAMSNYS